MAMMGSSSMGAERSRTLHNFSLPPRLTWGTQKLLRCSNNSQNDAVSVSDRRRRNASFKAPSSLSLSSTDDVNENNNNDQQIDVIREKLMLDLRSEVDKMRQSILLSHAPPRAGLQSHAPVNCHAPVEVVEEGRPWNLRTRRAVTGSETVAVKVVASPARDGDGETARVKFAVGLRRREIEDDFMEMTGRRPPRKPKKRPRYVQKHLDTLFPGLWLSEITPDMYKVNETPPEPPK